MATAAAKVDTISPNAMSSTTTVVAVRAGAPHHARRGSGNDVPAAVRDELAQPGAAQPLWLGPLACRLGIGESGQQLQPATATIGVEPLR